MSKMSILVYIICVAFSSASNFDKMDDPSFDFKVVSTSQRRLRSVSDDEQEDQVILRKSGLRLRRRVLVQDDQDDIDDRNVLKKTGLRRRLGASKSKPVIVFAVGFLCERLLGLLVLGFFVVFYFCVRGYQKLCHDDDTVIVSGEHL